MEDEYLKGGKENKSCYLNLDHLHSILIYLDNCGENWLAAGKSNQSVSEDVNSEWIVGCHIDVDPQVKLVSTDEVGLVKVPATTIIQF